MARRTAREHHYPRELETKAQEEANSGLIQRRRRGNETLDKSTVLRRRKLSE